jgi:hypothetical protein
MEVEEENRTLREELKLAQEKNQIAEELQPHDNAYWRVSGGGINDGPSLYALLGR